jgi:uncharacterized protein with gpF-like domain
MNPVFQAVMLEGIADLKAEVGMADDPWTMPSHVALQYIKTRDSNLYKVGTTARDQLDTCLTNAMQAGKNLNEVADDLRGVFTDLEKFEAKRIATTEVCAIDGFTRHTTTKGVGLNGKSWLTSHGPNVRDAHEAAEIKYGPGNACPVDEPFDVGGEDLMYPGDESGSPGNIINCQCIYLAARLEGKKAIIYLWPGETREVELEAAA